MKKLTAKALSLLTSVRLQRQQAKSTIATLIFTFLLQCTTYKKQVDADAGQGTIETEQKDVASGQTRQKTMAQKGRRVNLPLLPDSIIKDIYITDSMQALYDDEEWVIKQLHKQCNSNPEHVTFIKVDTIPPLFMEMFPGVDIYFSKDKETNEIGVWPMFEYCGYLHLLTSFNILYALVERIEKFTPEDQILCIMQIKYMNVKDFKINSIERTKFSYHKTEYNFVVNGSRLRVYWDAPEIVPYQEYIVYKYNQICKKITCYGVNRCGSALVFANRSPSIAEYFHFYNIQQFFKH